MKSIEYYLKNFDKNFYRTSAWGKKRAEVLERDNFECQLCKLAGRYSKATMVHHIKHYKDFPELALDSDNLISLCNACHEKQHPERNFKNENKSVHSERWE